MNISRRKLLKMACIGTCSGAIHQVFKPFNDSIAFADVFSLASNNKVMILLNLAGGCSLNISPIYKQAFFDKFPTTSYDQSNSLVLNSEQGLHPSLTSFKSAWDENSLALVNLVGYPNANRSHDESTEIWFRGQRMGSSSLVGGWAGRLTSMIPSTFAGISFSGTNSLIQGGENPPKALENLNNLGEDSLYWGTDGDWVRNIRDNMQLESSPAKSANLKFAKEAVDTLSSSLSTLKQYAATSLTTVFPNSGFGQKCADIAKLIANPSLGVKFIYIERGGFDTHTDERNNLTNNLNDINAGIAALVQELKIMNRWNDTTIVTMSEFGRTYENASAGTDHGHAAPMFLLGGKVKGGIVTPAPSDAVIASNARDYLADIHVDFRDVFKSVVNNLGYPGSSIFTESYNQHSPALSLYKA